MSTGTRRPRTVAAIMRRPAQPNLWTTPLLVLCCGMLIESVHSQGLSIFGPKTIRPNSNFTLVASNSLSIQLKLRATLENESGFSQAKLFTVNKRQVQAVTFYVGDINENSSDQFSLQIKSEDRKFSYDERVDLIFQRKNMSIFIQTDKPVYTPGDLVKFRVVVVDADTRPVTSIKTVSVTLEDSDYTSIRKWPFGKLYNGVFESQVRLASSPTLGNWTFTVAASDDHVVTKEIEVKEYVLPKFFVKVYPTEVLLVEHQKVSLTLEAFYTFDQPLDGTYTVSLFLDETKRKPDFVNSNRITGRTSLEFDLADEVDIDGDAQHADVTVTVVVTETFSNRTVNITEKVPIYRQPYVITFLPSAPSFRPGVPYDVRIVVKDQLGHIPTNEDNHAALNAEFALPSDSSFDNRDIYLNENGEGRFTLNPPTTAQQLTATVTYRGQEYEPLYEPIHAAVSLSKQYVKLTLVPKFRPVVNKGVDLEVSCTEIMTHISYIVVARGSIIKFSNIPVQNKKKLKFNLKLSPEMSPEARVLVFYMNREYLLFDDVLLQFDKFNNDFHFDLDEAEYSPGQEVYIDVYAAKDSYVAFSGIDKSVLLVRDTRHDFNRKDLIQELAQYGSTDDLEFDIINTYGLFLRSTATVDAPVSRAQSNANARFGTSIPGKIKKAIEIRTQFLESWLWRNFTMDGRNSMMRIRDTIPDTITTYSVSGFALSPTHGLGIVKQPASFVVRKPFYMVANLPYSIKRGEVALIQVTVFNFLGNNVTAHVTLFNKRDEIEFVGQSLTNSTYYTKAVLTTTNNGKPVSFLVKAKKLGQIAIKFEAVSQLDSDSLEHMLRVTPESHRYEKNIPRFVDLPAHGTQNFDLALDIPKSIDEGSARIVFTLDPNILGTAISNLDGLIRKPSGCGEQNMLHFVPNIVVLDYLSETGTVKDDVKSKAIDLLSSGYQNQLRYRRSDGSFSVWGQSHGPSTFLTAFVAKSLKIADKYITVDASIVNSAFAWLANQQTSDGRFPEVGTVWHADMQGGLRSNSLALTAYVLIAFAENEDVFNQYRPQLSKTANYLASQLDNIEDAYDLSLITYGLMLAKHSQRTAFFYKLVTTAKLDGDDRYWDRPPVSVEVTGYALLSYIAHGEILDATPIMRWLNKQRYGLGGFPGTQDTFVGLKALAKFAAKASGAKNDYRVRVLYEANQRKTFDVDDRDPLSIQTLELPGNLRKLKVEIDGIGNGVFQVSYQYYHNIVQAKPSFDITIDMLDTTTDHKQELRVCVKYIPKEVYQYTNMALVEVFLPSGLVADSDAIKNLDKKDTIKRWERRFSDTSIALYYEKLGPEYQCFEVTAYRRYKIALHLPAYVIVYDYYNDKRFAIKKYEGKVLQLCDICEDADCETLSCGNNSK